MRNTVFDFATADQERLVHRVPPGGVTTFSFGDEFAELPKHSPKPLPARPHPTDHKLFGPASPKGTNVKPKVTRPQEKDTCGQILHDVEHMPPTPVHAAKKHINACPKETNDLLDENRKADPVVHAAKKHSNAAPKEHNDLLEQHSEPVSTPVLHPAKKHVNPVHGDCSAILADQPKVSAVFHPARRLIQTEVTKDHWSQVMGGAAPVTQTSGPKSTPKPQPSVTPSSMQPQSAEQQHIPGRRVVNNTYAKNDCIGGLLVHADIHAKDSPYKGRANLGGRQTFVIA